MSSSSLSKTTVAQAAKIGLGFGAGLSFAFTVVEFVSNYIFLAIYS